VETFRVKLRWKDIHDHLRALCWDSKGIFAINDSCIEPGKCEILTHWFDARKNRDTERVIGFLSPLPTGDDAITMVMYQAEEGASLFAKFIERVRNHFTELGLLLPLEVAAAEPLPGGSDKPKSGPTLKTQERARVFRQLKDAHPGWSYDKVAVEACEELGEAVSGETVRNAYKAMEWLWERSDRIR